ncbi:MAG: SH3 domain-containing protein [Oscillospiraceae bacterium]|nr:SH3 domain-containing protein [Oscillospiraceae bacterium]
MKLKKILIVIITILIISLIFINISFGATVTVKADVLKIRDTPSTTGKILGNLIKGDKVDVVSQSGDWYQIKYDNGSKTGYVYKDYVTLNGSISGNTTNNTTNNAVNNTTNNTTNNAVNNTTNNISNNVVNNTTNNISNNTTNTNPGGNNTSTKVPTTSKIMLSSGSSMYILPSFISSTVLTVNEDSDMTALEKINDWSRIQCDGILGWVYNKDIINFDKIVWDTGTEQGGTGQKTGKVNVSSVNVRKSASTTAAILTTLAQNAQVTILSQSGNWYQIKTSKGVEGYVLASYITVI